MKKNNTAVIGHFDAIASSYDLFKKRSAQYYSTLKNAVKNVIINARSLTVLDIGCGTGDVLSTIHPKRGIGIDGSTQMILFAKQKYGANRSLSFSVHDIEKAPFPGMFDYILFTDVIEHLADKERAMKNISASMNKTTTLILTMANPFWEPLLMILEKLHLKMPEGPHQRISESDLLALLRKNSLTIMMKKTYFFTLIFLYAIKKHS